jgi:hypothetical protein
MKVIKQFYCIKEKKTYYIGNEYKGKRGDVREYLEQANHKKTESKRKSAKKAKTKKTIINKK